MRLFVTETNSFWNVEYTVFSEAQETWNAAAQYCRDLGSELIKTDSLDTMYALSVLLHDEHLISKE